MVWALHISVPVHADIVFSGYASSTHLYRLFFFKKKSCQNCYMYIQSWNRQKKEDGRWFLSLFSVVLVSGELEREKERVVCVCVCARVCACVCLSLGRGGGRVVSFHCPHWWSVQFSPLIDRVVGRTWGWYFRENSLARKRERTPCKQDQTRQRPHLETRHVIKVVTKSTWHYVGHAWPALPWLTPAWPVLSKLTTVSAVDS